VLRAPWAIVFGCVVACGPEVVLRPLELEIGGLSSRAEVLVVQLYPGSAGRTCDGVGLGSVKGLTAPYMSSWNRSAADRKLVLPDVEEDRVTVIVYSEDATGAAIQFACTEIAYEDLESPEFQIQLSARI
jgi:hypothetical protein